MLRTAMHAARFCLCALLFIPLAALAQSGGAEAIEPDSAASAPIEKHVGEKICFTLSARDRNGDAIRTWSTKGVNVTVTLLNATANTDTSERSWSADSSAYSWARLSRNGYYFIHRKPYTWTIPFQYFDTAGCFHVCFSSSKAEDKLRFNVWPDSVRIEGLAAPLRYLPTNFGN